MKNYIYSLILIFLCVTPIAQAQFARYARFLPTRSTQSFNRRFTGKVKNLFVTPSGVQSSIKESALNGDVARVDELLPQLLKTNVSEKREAITHLEALDEQLAYRINLVKRHTKPYLYLGALTTLHAFAQLATAGSVDMTQTMLLANSAGLLSSVVRYKAMQLELVKSSIDLALKELKQEVRAESMEDLN